MNDRGEDKHDDGKHGDGTRGADLTRRGFLQATLTGASAMALGGVAGVAGAAGATATSTGAASATASGSAAKLAGAKPLPTRPLGKSGRDVTILGAGGGSPSMNIALVEQAWALGIRYFDLSASYKKGQGEQLFAEFFAKHPELRKDAFFVTRGERIPNVEGILADVDERLRNCGMTYLDAYFLNGLGPREKKYGMNATDLLKSPELRKAVDKLKSSGKIKQFGFSCHDTAPMLTAAETGGVDLVMHMYDPFLEKGGALDKAMDACHKAGIGLVAMKTARMAIKKVPAKLPELEKLGLTTRQGLLHAAWSDERLSSVCVGMDNASQGEENAKAARLYKKPLTMAQMDLMHETVLASLPAMCPGCDGRCAEAAGKRELALNDVARMVSYYEMDGNEEAREWYRAMEQEMRDATGADLAAASHVCFNKLDFASILDKAIRYFG